MRKNIIVLITVVLLVGLGACGSSGDDDYAESTMVVAKRGRVSERLIENFDKDYYSLDELKGEFETSISQYNDNIGGAEIRLKKLELNGSLLTVDLEFTGPSDYENFTGESLFVGTVKDAYDNGYTMDVTLKGVDKDSHSEEDLELSSYYDIRKIAGSLRALAIRSIRFSPRRSSGYSNLPGFSLSVRQSSL